MRLLPISLSIFVICTMTYSCKKDSLEPSQNGQSESTNPQPASGERMMGALVLPAAEYAKLPKADAGVNYIESALPSSASLTCPPILNQGNEGSCVAWATAYAARSI